jgi:phenylacetic acid degradation operon negative regulatory protein
MGTRSRSEIYVFSLYGQYIVPRGGKEVWIGTLIQALGALDLKPGAVRTLASRMRRKGLLESRRVGRYSYYRLTERGTEAVHHGGRQAFAPSDATWDGEWTVVVYSVPERHRGRRDALRRLLADKGFGALTPGTWISPRGLSSPVKETCQSIGVWDYLEVFQARHLGPSQRAALVAQAWPHLGRLAEHYRRYVTWCDAMVDRLEATGLDGEACFAAQLRSTVDFVDITLQDPALPPALLPADWPRPAAHNAFERLQRVAMRAADRFFDRIYVTEAEGRGART